MSKRWLSIAAALAALGACGKAPAAVFTDVDPPGSQQTEVTTMDAAGNIAGWYLASDDSVAAFLRLKNGRYIRLGSAKRHPMMVIAGGRNQIAGWVSGSHGYIANTRNRFALFDVPGAAETFPKAFDASGAIGGQITIAGSQVRHGFLRGPDGGFATFDAPHAGTGGTFVEGVNASGAATGFARDDSGRSYGFLRKPDGSFIDVQLPDGTGSYFEPACINAKGEIAGHYQTGSTVPGFFRDAQGNYASFRTPRAWLMEVTAMNDSGTVTGHLGLRGRTRGFVRYPSGLLRVFDVPKRGRGSMGTFALGIDSIGAITGMYWDENGREHGFLRTP